MKRDESAAETYSRSHPFVITVIGWLQSAAQHRFMRRYLLPLVVLVSACSRAVLAPSVEPARVVVEVARPSNGGMSVPRAALISMDPVARSGVVYLVQADRAVRRSVAVGAVSGDRVEIASGITDGDEVITVGAVNLRDGDPVITVSRAGS